LEAFGLFSNPPLFVDYSQGPYRGHLLTMTSGVFKRLQERQPLSPKHLYIKQLNRKHKGENMVDRLLTVFKLTERTPLLSCSEQTVLEEYENPTLAELVDKMRDVLRFHFGSRHRQKIMLVRSEGVNVNTVRLFFDERLR
jgi:hypothetical protein